MRIIILTLLISLGIACTITSQYDKEFPSKTTETKELKVKSTESAQPAEIIKETYTSTKTVDPFFTQHIKPFMNKYCSDCHNNKKQKGKVNLEAINGFHANLESVDLWQEMYYQLEEGDMPPEDELQPSKEEKDKILLWISSQIDSKRDAMQKAAYTHMRRLNRIEYDRTVSDLLKIDTSLNSLSQYFPADDVKENLKNNGEALQVSAFHMAAYLEAAEKAVDKAVHFGAQPQNRTYTYLPPYKKSNNVLKAAREIGKNKFFDLVEQRSYAFHKDQENGVPVSGYYKVSAKVQSRNRIHQLNPKGFPIPQDNLLRASIVLSNPKTGDANYFTSSDRTAEEFQLPDQEIVEISGNYWIEKGYTAKIGFPTSVTRFKPAKRMGIDQKKFKEFFKGEKSAYGGFLNSQRVMQDHGPVVRVFNFKIEGPFYDEWPKNSHQELFGNKTLEELNLDETIDSFAAKAFRRPITSDDTASIKQLMNNMGKSDYTKLEILKAGLVAVLCSPQFFYLQEKEGVLDDYALASRLSYFLWSTMPDEELKAAAKAGKLSNPEELKKQTLRMIKSPKIDGFVNNFADGWLELDKLGTMPPDQNTNAIYYLRNLEHAGRQETIHFLKDLLVNNGDISNFLNSDYTFMNKGLAVFYGLKNPESFKYNEFKKTAIMDPRRGGLLGQMSLLTATANGVDTTPIIRGMWVLENLLGEHLDAPTDVPAVEPDVRGAKTLRQLLEKHRSDKNCYACHKKIDPPGFALESFDHIGRWRNVYNEHLSERQSKSLGIEMKLPVDSKGEMPDGQKFTDIIEFKKILMSKKVQFTNTLATKLLTYATGREIRAFEKEQVKKVAHSKKGFRDLIIAVTTSKFFNRK